MACRVASRCPMTFAIFDLRGRCNRTWMAIVALVLINVELIGVAFAWAGVIDLGSWPVIAFKIFITWIGSAAVSKRLHDLGISAWVILKAVAWVVAWSVVLTLAIMFTLGEASLAEREIGWWISVAGTAAPVLAATLWLHFAPGEPDTNRFGPVPTGWGFSPPPALEPVTQPVRLVA